jgi:ribosome modulation factor
MNLAYMQGFAVGVRGDSQLLNPYSTLQHPEKHDLWLRGYIAGYKSVAGRPPVEILL